MKKLILKLINLIIIFRIPLEYYGNIIKVSNFSLDAFILFICLILMSILIISTIYNELMKFDYQSVYLIIFSIISVISSLTSINRSLSLPAAGASIFNIFCFLIISNLFTKKELNLLMLSIIIGLSIPLIDTYLQLMFGSANYVNKQGYETLRVSGFLFQTKSFTAATLGFILLISVFLYQKMKNYEMYDVMTIKIKKSTTAIMIVILGGVILDGFRSAIILSFIFLIYLALFSYHISNKIRNLTIAGFILCFGLYLYYYFVPGGFAVLKKAVTIDYIIKPEYMVSTMWERKFFIKKYIFNFTVPPFGYGPGTFGLKNFINDSGSLYVNLWYSYGFIGFFSFLFFFVSVLNKNLKKKLFIYKYTVLIILLSLIGGITESTLLSIRGVYLFSILGVLNNYSDNIYKYQLDRRR